MANKLSPEVKVGFFTILAVVILLYMSFRTAGVSFTTTKFPMFTVKFKSVSGLERKSKVKLSGVEIGQVENVLLEDQHALVVVRLSMPAEIRRNSTATIKTSGLLGEKYVEIVQGISEAPLLEDGENLEQVVEAAEISDLVNKMGGAMDDIRVLTTSLKNLAQTMEGEQDLASIMRNVNESTLNLSAFIQENREIVHKSMVGLSQISEDFARISPQLTSDMQEFATLSKELLEKNNQGITDSLTSLRRLSDTMNGVLTDNRVNIKDLIASMTQASTRMDEVIDALKQASQSTANTAQGLESITSKIESGQGSIGKLMTETEVYDNLNDALKGARDLVGKAEDFGMLIGARTEYQSDLDTWKSFFTLKINPTPDKFYLVEVTEDLRRTDLDYSRNTLNSLLYTAMIGKRFSDITLRAGLIESATGAAIDIHLLNDNFTATAEAFNLSGYNAEAENAQIKAWLKWDFHKYMYLYAGADELLNERYRTYFAGGGILFDDKDLMLALSLR
ncbi:MAG: MlaD family protein [Nitrospinota bacterium]|nr:MlaD family protein [Nitrospinota bacterium]MDH5755591.1 MlaD family protein [Nitrospinota bacterium]